MDIDYRSRYLKEKPAKSSDTYFWIKMGKRSEQNVKDIVSVLGTNSPSEARDILSGIFGDLANGTLQLVEAKPSK